VKVERLLEPWETMKVWKTSKVLQMVIAVMRGKYAVQIFFVRLVWDVDPHSSNCQTTYLTLLGLGCLGLLERSPQTDQTKDLFAKTVSTMEFGSWSVGSLMYSLISPFSSSCPSNSSSSLDFLHFFLLQLRRGLPTHPEDSSLSGFSLRSPRKCNCQIFHLQAF